MEARVDNKLSFYDDTESHESVFYIWERGGALGDSVTPATNSIPYQDMIVNLIAKHVDSKSKLFSIGCGNATIESRLQNIGYDITAIDAHPIAVKIARTKGINVSHKSIFETTSGELQNIDLIYSDGVLGHMFSETTLNLDRFIDYLKDHAPKRPYYFLCSNDSTKNGEQFAMHPRVDGFWYLSVPYLKKSFEAHGFQIIHAGIFVYQRPISGACERSVLLMKYNREDATK